MDEQQAKQRGQDLVRRGAFAKHTPRRHKAQRKATFDDLSLWFSKAKQAEIAMYAVMNKLLPFLRDTCRRERRKAGLQRPWTRVMRDQKRAYEGLLGVRDGLRRKCGFRR
jgi:predicted secreted Zn-dependent protease